MQLEVEAAAGLDRRLEDVKDPALGVRVHLERKRTGVVRLVDRVHKRLDEQRIAGHHRGRREHGAPDEVLRYRVPFGGLEHEASEEPVGDQVRETAGDRGERHRAERAPAA